MPYTDVHTEKSMAKALKDKFAIAAALQEIGALLELKGGQYFKARAYKSGARAVAELTEDIGKLVKENRLTFVKGIGYALAKQIQALYATGEAPMLNELRAQLPSGIIELSHVPGLSVQKVERLQQALGISSVDELKAACEAGKVRHVKGFGAKTEQKILDAIAGHENREQFIHIHHAWRISERLLEYLATARGFVNGEVAGATRRGKETVSEIVIVAATKNPKALIDHCLHFPLVIRVESQGRAQCSVVLSEGYKATLIAVRPEQFAFALLRATGSDAHLKRLNQIATKKKFSMFKNGPRKLKSEREVYKRLGVQYVPPELREDAGEIEAALKGTLPED